MNDDVMLADFLASRDEAAFEVLVRRHGPMVLRACRDILGDRDDAEDAFQATFLVLSRHAGSIRDRGSLGRWLYGVACRISRRARSRATRRRARERQALVMEAASPPDFDAADRELRPILHEEIGRLPSRLRDAIVLCYFEGLTVEEAARRLDCPVGTLKSRLVKGRDTLRSRLVRRGLAASALLMILATMTDGATAGVPEGLVEATVKAGVAGVDAAVSPSVAALLRDEEAKVGGLSKLGWMVLLLVAGILGAVRLSSADSNPARNRRAAVVGSGQAAPATHCQ